MTVKAGMEEAARSRRLIIVSASCLTLAFLFIGFYQFQQRQRLQNTSLHMALSLDPQEQEKTRKANISQATMLHEQWKGWAKDHKEVLRTMMYAKRGDPAVFNQLLQALPNRKESGMVAASFKENGTQFTWQPLGNNFSQSVIADPNIIAKRKEEQKAVEALFKEEFTAHGDVIVSRSVNVGPTYISLWASGKVTRTTAKLERVSRASRFVDGPPKVIISSYDFLR